jgi:Leucine-rich repeat (LRR) protein
MASSNEKSSDPEQESKGMAKVQWRIEKARRKKATFLDLSELELSTLPEALGQLTNLQKLNLSGNQLTTLPESLGQLTNLQLLYLFDNQLTTLPESLEQLTNLQWLFLNNNQLTALPESLGAVDEAGNRFTSTQMMR